MSEALALDGMELLARGKVRDIYAVGTENLLLVASDRISTYDVVHPTPIPDKGRVLTGLSMFWFERTRELCPNHVVSFTEMPAETRGRGLLVERLEMLPVECVVPHDLRRPAEVDVLVVIAHLRLGRRGEERLGQLLGLLEALGQLDPADRAGGLVVPPTRPGEVAADHALDREHLQALDQERAPSDFVGHVAVGEDVVGDEVLGAPEPELRQSGEHGSLVGDRCGVNHVVG